MNATKHPLHLKREFRGSAFISILSVAAYLSSVSLVESQSIVSMTSPDELNLQTDATKTYFLQESEDLKNWYPLSTYIIGDGALKQVSLPAPTGSKKFFRFTIVPTNNSDPDDSDNDGIENNYEFQIGLDPTQINSVSELSMAEVDSRIADTDPTVSMSFFNNYNATAGGAMMQRNPNCWASSINDITCMSYWNSAASRQRAGTLITPRHVIFCAHSNFFVQAGAKMHFANASGNVIERTVQRTQRHPGYNSSTHVNDIVIGVLDQDVPSSIAHATILPTDWSDYLYTSIFHPSLRLNQHEQALIGNVLGSRFSQSRIYHSYPSSGDRVNYSKSPNSPTGPPWFGGLYPGDSGNPGFLVINNQLVILNVWTFGGAGSGSSIFHNKTVINTIISDLDQAEGSITGYQLEEADFSSFVKLADIPAESQLISSPGAPDIDESEYPLLVEPTN